MFSEELLAFEGREEKLKSILRYNMAIRTPMFYRTNDLIHSQRVFLLLKDISDVVKTKLGDNFNLAKALHLALVHDDAEIITGDIQLYYKERMTQDQLLKVHADEENAIAQLSKMWPTKFGDFSYADLLLHALKKDCVEAQIVSYCDKIDAFCESLHELLAGNPRFVGSAESYVFRIRDFPNKFPVLGKIFPSDHPLLSWPAEIDSENLLRNGNFHDINSLKIKTGISHYDRWKEITLEHLGSSSLVEIKEK